MNKILITVDNKDETLGYFFDLCRQHAETLANTTKNFNYITLESNKLKNSIFIDMEIAKFNNYPFIFLAFSHGCEDGLLAQDDYYIKYKQNHFQFRNAFIYNFSCLTGVTLGKELINSGAKSFVGHNEEIIAHHVPKFQKAFHKPIFYFLEAFFENKTISECIKKTKDLYTEEIDNLYEDDFLTASALLINRDSLVCYGSDSCTIHDFESAS